MPELRSFGKARRGATSARAAMESSRDTVELSGKRVSFLQNYLKSEDV